MICRPFLLERALALLLLLLPFGGSCDPGGPPTDTRTQATQTPAQPAVAGRALVLRIGAQGVALIRQAPLPRAPRPLRRPSRYKGRFEVRDARGAVLATGSFRLPRTRHALFGDVDGPSEGVTVPVRAPVVFVKVPTPAGARTVSVYDERGRVRLGEVAL